MSVDMLPIRQAVAFRQLVRPEEAFLVGQDEKEVVRPFEGWLPLGALPESLFIHSQSQRQCAQARSAEEVALVHGSVREVSP
jgi:hypothetical protein